ncbi:MAG TPA: hypothetical protein VFY17_01310 [Pilimelia sp.]|nr:hypothetical protein [Pilimelia sp.]
MTLGVAGGARGGGRRACGVPDEDEGPAWQQDWQAIEADIHRPGDLAEALRAQMERSHVPHLAGVAEAPEATAEPADTDAAAGSRRRSASAGGRDG